MSLIAKSSENEIILNDSITAHLVIPDVINKLPESKLDISYNNNTTLRLGNLVLPEHTDIQPKINLNEFNEQAYYTLIMTDPDVPNRIVPTEREHLHWLIINITSNLIEKGRQIVPYEPPLPKRGSGLHRYIFILLEQSSHIVYDMTDLKNISVDTNLPIISNSLKSTDQQALKNSKKVIDIEKKTIGLTEQKYQLHKDNKESADNTPTITILNTNNLNLTKQDSIEEIQRNCFSTKDYITKYMIRSITAANFFQTEFNDYVGKKLLQLEKTAATQSISSNTTIAKTPNTEKNVAIKK